MSDIQKEYDSILDQLSDPELISDWERFEKLNKKKESLEKIIEAEKEVIEIQNKIEENNAIISAREDQDLIILAESEMAQLQEKKRDLEEKIKSMIAKKDTPIETDSSKPAVGAVIVEIRAGAGGSEASLFVSDMYRMYSKYGQSAGWKVKTLDSSSTELGGFKEIVFELDGKNTYSKMQNEAGVHRVQRIPKTEKAGRVHTSTVSVAVLPKPKKTELNIRPDELQIDTYRSSGPGGQYVNKRETAVRITHLPTGLVVSSQTERNQLQNKENALSILAARVLEKKEQMAMAKLGTERRSQIGGAKRAEKIRTYNFAQDRITDHRIKKSFHNLEMIMEGNLDPIFDSLSDYQE